MSCPGRALRVRVGQWVSQSPCERLKGAGCILATLWRSRRLQKGESVSALTLALVKRLKPRLYFGDDFSNGQSIVGTASRTLLRRRLARATHGHWGRSALFCHYRAHDCVVCILRMQCKRQTIEYVRRAILCWSHGFSINVSCMFN